MRLSFEMPLKNSLKLWSQRVNVLASMVVAYIVANPGEIARLLEALPEPWRLAVAPFAGLIVFFVVSFARLASQPKLKPGATDNADI